MRLTRENTKQIGVCHSKRYHAVLNWTVPLGGNSQKTTTQLMICDFFFWNCSYALQLAPLNRWNNSTYLIFAVSVFTISKPTSAAHVRPLRCTSQSHPHGCRDKPLRSFLYSLMLDCGTSLTEWKSEVKKKNSFDLDVLSAYDFIDHVFWMRWIYESKYQRVTCECSDSFWVKATQYRASCKMLQKSRKEKKKKCQIVCVYSLHSRLFIQHEKNCVDFMSLLGENY